MKRNFRLKAISVFMAMLFVVQVIPMSVVAQGSTDLGNESVPAANGFDNHSEKTEGDGAIVSEVTELREENVKHFKCDNGKYMAVVYGEPVHYKENGKWKEVDNTLTLSSPADGKAAKYTTMSSATPVSIPQALSDGQKIEITKDDYTVGFGVSAGNKDVNFRKKAEITDVEKNDGVVSSKTESKSVEAVNDEKTAVKNSSSAVTYSGIFPGADLEYIVSPSTVKENIIVKKRGQEYIYKFDMNLDGLVPVTCDDGSIELVEDGENEPVFVIQAPYMYDANGEYCYDVTMTLSGNTLTVKADSDWINDADRALPVVIDPTVYTISSDMVVARGVTNLFPNTYTGMAVGRSIYRYRTYVKLNLPTLPTNSSYHSATLNIYQTSHVTNTSAAIIASQRLNIYDLEAYDSWSTSSITWNNQPVSTDLNSYSEDDIWASAAYQNTDNVWYNFDVSDMVESWYEAEDNNGCLISFSDESQFIQSFFSSSTNYHRLCVYYVKRCACGSMCDYWSTDTSCPCNCSSYETCNCSCCGSYCNCGKLNCNYGKNCECECASESVCNCVACKGYKNSTTNEVGNVTSSEISDGTKTMSQDYTYTDDGKKMTSSVDANGNIVYYDYDETSGLLESKTIESTNPEYDDSVTNYSYNTEGLQSEVSQNVSDLLSGTSMTNEYTYNANGQVTSITRNGFSYNLVYDEDGNNTQAKIGDQTLATYTYDSENRATSVTYSNGDIFNFSYTSSGELSEISRVENEVAVPAYTYEIVDDYGMPEYAYTRVTDYINNRIIEKYYDGTYYMCDIDENFISDSYQSERGYNDDFDEKTVSLFEDIYLINRIYDKSFNFQTGETSTHSELEFSNIGQFDEDFVTDYFDRLTKIDSTYYSVTDDAELVKSITFSYNDTSTTAGTEITSYSATFSYDSSTVNGISQNYEYDNRGNITRVYDASGTLASYVYNEANQIVRENNLSLDKTTTYVYDMGGNIVSKNIYPFTTGALGTPTSTIAYTYDSVWKDKLMSYNNMDISYDALGNPIEYGEDIEYSWYGKDLSGCNIDNLGIEYTYDQDGRRTTKIVSDGTSSEPYVYNYVWSPEGTLLGYNVDTGSETIEIVILYDQKGNSIGFSFDEHVLYYVKNLQGDVVKIIDSEGNTILNYKYDAWGKTTFAFEPGCPSGLPVIAACFNPITYRGYYFDSETGLFYLDSEYYNPEWGRTLNLRTETYTEQKTLINESRTESVACADDITSNLYSYSDANPVMNVAEESNVAKASNENTNILDEIYTFFVLLFGGVAIKNGSKYPEYLYPYVDNTRDLTAETLYGQSVNWSAEDNTVVSLSKKSGSKTTVKTLLEEGWTTVTAETSSRLFSTRSDSVEIFVSTSLDSNQGYGTIINNSTELYKGVSTSDDGTSDSYSSSENITLGADHKVWVHGTLGDYYYVRPEQGGVLPDKTDSANFYFVEKSKVNFGGGNQEPSMEYSDIRDPNGSYVWPLDQRFRITQYYNASTHRAIDMSGTTSNPIEGQNVYAAKGGKVYSCCNSASNTPDKNLTDVASYGNYMLIDHGSKKYTRYAHMEYGSIPSAYDTKGDSIPKGHIIGRAGHSGNCGDGGDPHLHYEYHDGGIGRNFRLNPLDHYDDKAAS